MRAQQPITARMRVAAVTMKLAWLVVMWLPACALAWLMNAASPEQASALFPAFKEASAAFTWSGKLEIGRAHV